MKDGIIADWMSLAKLKVFTACNLTCFVVFALIRRLMVWMINYKGTYIRFDLAPESILLFTNMTRMFCLFGGCLGFSLIILGKVGRMSGIEKSREMLLVLTGVADLIISILFIWRI